MLAVSFCPDLTERYDAGRNSEASVSRTSLGRVLDQMNSRGAVPVSIDAKKPVQLWVLLNEGLRRGHRFAFFESIREAATTSTFRQGGISASSFDGMRHVLAETETCFRPRPVCDANAVRDALGFQIGLITY
jgi:hypothetical protein